MPKKQKQAVNTVVKVSENGQTVEYPIANTNQVRIKMGGDRSWRNNNTGNLKSMFTSKSNSPIGFNNDFAVFPDVRTGENAQVELLKKQMYQDKSIAGAIEKYASHKDRNDTEKYIKTVAGWTGMSRDKVLSSMTLQRKLPRQVDSFKVEFPALC